MSIARQDAKSAKKPARLKKPREKRASEPNRQDRQVLRDRLADTFVTLARTEVRAGTPPGEWSVAAHAAVVDHMSASIALLEDALAAERDARVTRSLRSYIRQAKRSRALARSWLKLLKEREKDNG